MIIEHTGTEVEKYCKIRLISFKKGGNGKITIYNNTGEMMTSCDNLGQLDEILSLSSQKLIPTLHEIGFFLIRGGFTAIGFLAVEYAIITVKNRLTK